LGLRNHLQPTKKQIVQMKAAQRPKEVSRRRMVEELRPEGSPQILRESAIWMTPKRWMMHDASVGAKAEVSMDLVRMGGNFQGSQGSPIYLGIRPLLPSFDHGDGCRRVTVRTLPLGLAGPTC